MVQMESTFLILRMYKLTPEKRKEMGVHAAKSAKRIDIQFTADGKMELFKKLLSQV